MKFIKGKDRSQAVLFPVSLEHSIDPDNEVRFIDLFVDSLKLADFGFKTIFPENGRPAYHPSDLSNRHYFCLTFQVEIHLNE